MRLSWTVCCKIPALQHQNRVCTPYFRVSFYIHCSTYKLAPSAALSPLNDPLFATRPMLLCEPVLHFTNHVFVSPNQSSLSRQTVLSTGKYHVVLICAADIVWRSNWSSGLPISWHIISSRCDSNINKIVQHQTCVAPPLQKVYRAPEIHPWPTIHS